MAVSFSVDEVCRGTSGLVIRCKREEVGTITNTTTHGCISTWAIHNVTHLSSIRRTRVSPYFTINKDVPGKWQMRLEVADDARGPSLSVYVEYTPPYQQPLPFTMLAQEMSIQDKRHNLVRNQGACISYTTKDKHVWGWPKFMFSNASLLPEDTLTLVFSGTLEVHHSETTAVTLQSDIPKLLGMDNICDALLISSEGTEVRAHTAVLCARSPVFAAMYHHDTREKQEGKVLIQDISEEVLRGMLYYMYTDKPPEIMETLAGDILRAAEKYDLQGLKNMCEVKLGEQLSLDNLLQTMALAKDYGCGFLSEVCLGFGMGNLYEWKRSPFWKEAREKRPDLLLDVLEKLI